MKGWAIEGIIPYTRRALWRKRGAPKPDSPELPNFSWTSSSLPGTSVSGVGPMPNDGDDDAASVDAPDEMMVQAPITRPIPEPVRDAMNFMKNATMPSGNVSVEDVMASHIKLVEACQLHAAYWSNVPVVSDDATTTMDRRITSRNIFGLPGSAT